MEMYENNPYQFKNVCSGFYFFHEEYAFQEEYEQLQCKYQKRIARFLQETTKKTCFLRAVISSEEVKYIKDNWEYIDRVIKKGGTNPHNEIIFWIYDGVEVSELPFKYFKMGTWSTESRMLTRNWFDKEPEFLDFCVRNFDSSKLMKNILFDKQLENQEYQIIEQRYALLNKILEKNWKGIILPKRIMIYGAGNIGKQFYKMIKTRCEVIAFVDKYKMGMVFEGVPIMGISESASNEKYHISSLLHMILRI